MSLIIRISGASGSGKTTLGQKLKNKYKDKIAVIDTDFVIQDDDEHGKYLRSIEHLPDDEYIKLWEERVKTIINNTLKEYSIPVIIVGTSNIYTIEKFRYDIPADHKYFIDISMPDLLKNYYTRLCKFEEEVSKAESNKFWKQLSKGKRYILSSKECMENAKDGELWHKEHGYSIENRDTIYEKICKILDEKIMI